MNGNLDIGSARGARGLALVTVLWVLVLLSLIAASFTFTTRTEVTLTRNQIENAQAEALAEAGLARALLGLLAGQRNIDFGDEVEKLLVERPGLRGALEARPEVQTAQAAREAGLAEAEPAVNPETGEPLAGEAWRADGTVYAWAFGGPPSPEADPGAAQAGGELRVAVHSEAGKIDLNAADETLLRGLFLAARWAGADGEPRGLDESEAAALTDAVRDFADPDDLTRLNGAEDRDYAAAGLPWGAKDAPFEAVEELQQVRGMTAGLYEAVAPALTVYTGRPGVDPQFAPREVLLALSAAAGGADGEAAVDDYLAARAEAAPGAAPEFLAAEGRRAARGRARVYTIHAEARGPGGAVFAREAVVRLGRGARAYRIEAWRQGVRRLFR